MSRVFPSRRTAAALVALALAGGALPAAAQTVGVAGAVNPATTGQPPGQAARTIFIGNDVVFNERVTTTADGQAQLIFLDRSSFSIGPDSDIVIDEFVYDPNAGTGRLVATAAKGVFRFVGGALSKQDGAVSVRAPSATIGVRGGMFSLTIGGDGTTTVIKNYGDALTVTTPGGATQRILRNDFFTRVNAGGTFGIDRPLRAPPQLQQALAAPLNPPPGTSGGAAQVPTSVTIQQSGYSRVNSENVAGIEFSQRAIQTASVDATAVARSQNVETTQVLSTTTQLAGTMNTSTPMVTTANNPLLNVGANGLVRGQLVWTNNSDLDLHLFVPGSTSEVFFANRSVVFNNGQAFAVLDADNLGGVINVAPDKRVENIVVTGSQIPAGTYNFRAVAFSERAGGTPYTLSATGDGGRTFVSQTGTFTQSGQQGALLPVVSPGGSTTSSSAQAGR